MFFRETVASNTSSITSKGWYFHKFSNSEPQEFETAPLKPRQRRLHRRVIRNTTVIAVEKPVYQAWNPNNNNNNNKINDDDGVNESNNVFLKYLDEEEKGDKDDDTICILYYGK